MKRHEFIKTLLITPILSLIGIWRKTDGKLESTTRTIQLGDYRYIIKNGLLVNVEFDDRFEKIKQFCGVQNGYYK